MPIIPGISSWLNSTTGALFLFVYNMTTVNKSQATKKSCNDWMRQVNWRIYGNHAMFQSKPQILYKNCGSIIRIYSSSYNYCRSNIIESIYSSSDLCISYMFRSMFFNQTMGRGLLVQCQHAREISVSALSGATVPMLGILLLFLLEKTNLLEMMSYMLGMNSIFLSYYIPLICEHWR